MTEQQNTPSVVFPIEDLLNIAKQLIYAREQPALGATLLERIIRADDYDPKADHYQAYIHLAYAYQYAEQPDKTVAIGEFLSKRLCDLHDEQKIEALLMVELHSGDEALVQKCTDLRVRLLEEFAQTGYELCERQPLALNINDFNKPPSQAYKVFDGNDLG